MVKVLAGVLTGLELPPGVVTCIRRAPTAAVGSSRILRVSCVPAASMVGLGSNETPSAGEIEIALVNCKLAPRMIKLTALLRSPKIGSMESMRGAPAVIVNVALSALANDTDVDPAMSETARTPIAAAAPMVIGIVTERPSPLATGDPSTRPVAGSTDTAVTPFSPAPLMVIDVVVP